MITLFILIALIGLGIYLESISRFEILGICMIIIFALALIFHSFAWGMKSYNYELFVEKRNSFEQTLIYAREKGNNFETAAIVSEVAKLNMKLVSDKYRNKTLLLDQYFDDRVELLEPIK
jgi:hypothetical protein